MYGLGLFQFMSNNDSALYYLNKCLDFDTTKASKEIWCVIYLGIGSCYIRNLEYDKSYWYFNKSLQHLETGEGYFCLATYYLFKGNTEETIRYLKKSSDMGYQLAIEKLKSDYNIEY
jgi:tetratricopeptide (TPR) repeat protein